MTKSIDEMTNEEKKDFVLSARTDVKLGDTPSSEEAQRFFVSELLQVMAEKVRSDDQIVGFTITWKEGQQLNVTEERRMKFPE
jgi:hypothetical protein